MIKFRNIKANEIDLRVGSTNKDKTGFSLLLYKDARVDANILDETVGAENWQCKYYQVKNTMVCSVGINVYYDQPERGTLWVFKDDGGDDDYQAEKVKGELSDAFKRACFRWNIARRNLYSSPFIWVNVTAENQVSSYYIVSKIGFDENDEINELVIVNEKTKKVVYSYGNSSPKIQHEEKPQVDTQTVLKDRTELYSIVLKKYGDDVGTFNSWLSRKYGVGSLKELPDDKVGEVLAIMRKAKQ